MIIIVKYQPVNCSRGKFPPNASLNSLPDPPAPPPIGLNPNSDPRNFASLGMSGTKGVKGYSVPASIWEFHSAYLSSEVEVKLRWKVSDGYGPSTGPTFSNSTSLFGTSYHLTSSFKPSRSDTKGSVMAGFAGIFRRVLMVSNNAFAKTCGKPEIKKIK